MPVPPDTANPVFIGDRPPPSHRRLSDGPSPQGPRRNPEGADEAKEMTQTESRRRGREAATVNGTETSTVRTARSITAGSRP